MLDASTLTASTSCARSLDRRMRVGDGIVRIAWVLALTLLAATGCRGKAPTPASATKQPAAAVASAQAQPSGPAPLTQPVVLQKPPAEPLPAVVAVPKKKMHAALKSAQQALAAGRLDERDMSPAAAVDQASAIASSDSSTPVQPAPVPTAAAKPPDALALYRGILATDPKDAAALGGLDGVIASLHVRVEAAIARGDIVNAQRDADRIGLLRADDPGLPALKPVLDQAWHVAGLIERGQRLELAGALIAPRTANAAAAYRQALALAPTNTAAEAGLERVEGVFIARAIAEANAAHYPQSEQLLAQAASVRPDSKAVKDAALRVASIRERHASLLAAQANAAAASGDPDRAARLLVEIERTSPRSPLVRHVRARIVIARNYGVFRPGEVFTERLASKGVSPEMIVLPIGSFMMGSSDADPGHDASEMPQRRIEFKHGFAMSRTEITVRQFARFVQATHYRTDAEHSGHSMVYDEAKGKLDARNGVTWRDDYAGRRAAVDDPVMHVSWNDAQAYTIWLSKETSQLYRMPSEAEFEYGLRSGSTGAYPWPNAKPPANIANLAGKEVSPSGRHWGNAFADYDDGFWGSAPVAHFAANTFGLYDMVGNVSEWTLDCWHDDYRRAPENASAWVNPGCAQRVIRGSSWSASPDQSRSAHRAPADAASASARIGFRIVREI